MTYSGRTQGRKTISRSPIVPERVRRINGLGFSFIHHRFLRDGFFVSLTRDELALYFLLVLAGDRNGVSFYHYDSICALLQMTVETYLEARNGLIAKDLIAYDGTRFQVLSLPARSLFAMPKPLTTERDFEEHDQATVRHLILSSLHDTDTHDQ